MPRPWSVTRQMPPTIVNPRAVPVQTVFCAVGRRSSSHPESATVVFAPRVASTTTIFPRATAPRADPEPDPELTTAVPRPLRSCSVLPSPSSTRGTEAYAVPAKAAKAKRARARGTRRMDVVSSLVVACG